VPQSKETRNTKLTSPHEVSPSLAMVAALLEGCSSDYPIALRNPLVSPSCLIDTLANAISSVSRQDLIQIGRLCVEAWGKIFGQEFLQRRSEVCGAHLVF